MPAKNINKYLVRVTVEHIVFRYYDVEVESKYDDSHFIQRQISDNYCEYIPNDDDFCDEEFVSSQVQDAEILETLVSAEERLRNAKIELLKAKLLLLENGSDVDFEDLASELED